MKTVDAALFISAASPEEKNNFILCLLMAAFFTEDANLDFNKEICGSDFVESFCILVDYFFRPTSEKENELPSIAGE
jgi:hypothetical protein